MDKTTTFSTGFVGVEVSSFSRIGPAQVRFNELVFQVYVEEAFFSSVCLLEIGRSN